MVEVEFGDLRRLDLQDASDKTAPFQAMSGKFVSLVTSRHSSHKVIIVVDVESSVLPWDDRVESVRVRVNLELKKNFPSIILFYLPADEVRLRFEWPSQHALFHQHRCSSI